MERKGEKEVGTFLFRYLLYNARLWNLFIEKSHLSSWSWTSSFFWSLSGLRSYCATLRSPQENFFPFTWYPSACFLVSGFWCSILPVSTRNIQLFLSPSCQIF